MLKAVLIYGFVFATMLAHSQSEVVDLSNFDSSILNELLIDYTNQLRKRKRKQKLSYFPKLDAAAKNHADYMAARKYLGHIQKNKALKTVKDRVVMLGGDADFVGENVQYISINYEIEQADNKLTYENLAVILGEQWRKSKGHYANMIDGNYNGVSHQFAIKDGLLYACQVFTSKPFEPIFDFQIGEGFNVKNKKPCHNCKKTKKKYDKDQIHYGWYNVSNDSLFYYNYRKINITKQLSLGSKTKTLTFSKNNIRKIFSRKGKLSVDFIHQTQIDCFGNAIYDGALNYDGYFLGYIDKKKVKNLDLSYSRNYIELYLGQIPEVEDENFQIDFFLTKRDRPCSQQSLVFISPDYFKPWEFFQLQHPQIKVGQDQLLTDSIVIKVPFSRNEISENEEIFIEVLDVIKKLKLDSVNVTRLKYTGIASIEGTESINRALINDRAEAIGELLAKHYPGLDLSHQLIENFSGFRLALQEMNNDKWQNASDSELRAYANKNKNKPKIEALLDNSRQSEITFFSQRHYSSVELSPTLNNLKILMGQKESEAALLVWQQLTKKAIEGDSLLADILINLKIPEQKLWKNIHWEQFVLDLKVNKSVVSAERLNQLYKLGAIPSETDYLIYRLMFNLFYNEAVCQLDDYEAVYSKIKSKNVKNWVYSLYLIHEYESGRITTNLGPQLSVLASSGRFTAYQTYFVSQYIMRYDFANLAFALLERYAKQSNQFPKLYQQYLKLSYYYFAFENDQQFKIDAIVFRHFANLDSKDFCQIFKWFHIGIRCLERPLISGLYCETCT